MSLEAYRKIKKSCVQSGDRLYAALRFPIKEIGVFFERIMLH